MQSAIFKPCQEVAEGFSMGVHKNRGIKPSMLRGIYTLTLLLAAAFAVVTGAQEMSAGSSSGANVQGLVNDARIDQLNTALNTQAAIIASTQTCTARGQLYNPVSNTTPPNCVDLPSAGGGAPTVTNRTYYFGINPCTSTALHNPLPSNTTCIAVTGGSTGLNMSVSADACFIRGLAEYDGTNRSSVFQNGTDWYLSFENMDTNAFVSVSCLDWPASGPLVGTPAPPVCNSPNVLNWNGTAWSCNAVAGGGGSVPAGTLAMPISGWTLATPNFNGNANLWGMFYQFNVPNMSTFACQAGYSETFIIYYPSSGAATPAFFCVKT